VTAVARNRGGSRVFGDEPDFAETSSPWSRPSFVLGALLIVAVVVVGLGIAVGLKGDPAARVPTEVATGAVVGGGPAKQDGPLPTTVPTVAPAGTEWKYALGANLPYNPAHGPWRESSTTASGFAHSPEGALFAAAHLIVRGSGDAGRAAWEPTVATQFVAGPDRDALLARLGQTPVTEQVQPGDYTIFAGFTFPAPYRPEFAVIQLVHMDPANNAYYSTLVSLVWQDGDWRMNAPSGGDWKMVTGTTQPGGFVEWGPQ
jgi:hypothetical protein